MVIVCTGLAACATSTELPPGSKAPVGKTAAQQEVDIKTCTDKISTSAAELLAFGNTARAAQFNRCMRELGYEIAQPTL
jgi:hypothetical protein